MFWSTPAPPSSAAAPSSQQRSSSSSSSIIISRNIHLSSYLNHTVLKPSTRKVSSDDTIYDTVFQTTNGYALILRVTLPHDVHQPPTLALHGVRALHNWIDTQMKVVGYSPISSGMQWKQSKMKLGDAVYAVIHHFQLNPPTIIEITDFKLKQYQTNLANSSNTTTPPPTTSTMTASETTIRPTNSANPPSQKQKKNLKPKPNFNVSDEEIAALLPSIPPSFPSIETMTSISEITRLIEDESLLSSFIEQINEIQVLREIKMGIEQSNIEAAKSNLHREIQLDEMQSEIIALEREVATQLQHYNVLHARRVAMTEPPSVQTAISELSVAKKDAYRLSESLAERWIESGEGTGSGCTEDVGEFVKQFMEMRMLYHCRAAKAERLENSSMKSSRDSIFPSLL